MKELLFLYSNCNRFVYRVSERECLFEICKKFNQTPRQIILNNQLSCMPMLNSLIYIERGEGLLYMVKVDDTLEKIANRYGKSEEEILQNNNVQYIFPYQIESTYQPNR